MTTLQTFTANSGAATQINEIVRTLSPAGLYGIDPATTTGLTLGYYGGVLDGVSYADGTHLLTASTTRYVVAARATGVVSSSTGTTNWDDQTNYLRMGVAVVGASTITTWTDWREAYGATGGAFTGGTLAAALNEAPPVTLASATTVNIGAAAANTISITGTTPITAFDTIAAGAVRRLVFSGILTLTHNATSLILPTGASITTAAGDVAEFVSLGSGNWRCIAYMRASGAALAGSGGMTNPMTTAGDLILGGVSGVPGRLGIGTNDGQVLSISGGNVVWAPPRILQNSQSSAYTLLISDAGKHIFHPAADTTARIWTIPANASVAFPVGTAITFDNDFGAGVITISITSDTLVLVGATGSTGSRTLASGGQATALKVDSTRWRISGTGLT